MQEGLNSSSIFNNASPFSKKEAGIVKIKTLRKKLKKQVVTDSPASNKHESSPKAGFIPKLTSWLKSKTSSKTIEMEDLPKKAETDKKISRNVNLKSVMFTKKQEETVQEESTSDSEDFV